jgi:hypothetical protein
MAGEYGIRYIRLGLPRMPSALQRDERGFVLVYLFLRLSSSSCLF